MKKKKWVVERFKDDLLPLMSNEMDRHAKLGLRECVILVSSIIDAGLAELISSRLAGPEHEIVEFLGADEDGRAPCASFGSRIQLAALLGIIKQEDVVLLRLVKGLRNLAAHRVKFDISDQRVANKLAEIYEAFKWPLIAQLKLVGRIMLGDKKLLKKLKESPDWRPEIDDKLALATKSVETNAEFKKFVVWFLEMTPKGPENLASKMLAIVPSFVRSEPKVGPYLLAVLLQVYSGRFKLLLENIARVDSIVLPNRAMKMWESDEIEKRRSKRKGLTSLPPLLLGNPTLPSAEPKENA
jgi:hypothetical protein